MKTQNIILIIITIVRILGIRFGINSYNAYDACLAVGIILCQLSMLNLNAIYNKYKFENIENSLENINSDINSVRSLFNVIILCLTMSSIFSVNSISAKQIIEVDFEFLQIALNIAALLSGISSILMTLIISCKYRKIDE